MLKSQFSFMVLVVLAVTSVKAQNQDDFASFQGKWKHTKLFCRSFNGAKINEYSTKLTKSGEEMFYPDVELKFSSGSMNLNGQVVPAKNLEKAVTQGSCKLPKPTMSAMNQSPGNANYIWSKNQIALQPKANINGIQYYEMSGYLLEKKVNYADIRDCGREDGKPVSLGGLVSALFTYYRYDLGKSYFQVEADRKYNVYIQNGTLNLEFFEKDICAQANERVVMQFSKVPTL